MTEPLSMRVRGLVVREVIGEPWKVIVQSKGGQKEYVCDFVERWGSCSCSCADFAYRRWPKFKKDAHVDPCVHAISGAIFLTLRESARTLVMSAQETE